MGNSNLVQEKIKEFVHDLDTRKNMQILNRKIGGLNIFSILKTENTEIRHSNILAWLIDPNGSHGLDTEFAEAFFINISNKLPGNETFISKLIIYGLDNIIVYREKNNIDILIVSKNTNQIIVIENKTGSGLHDNQLERYENNITEQYPNYQKLLLYLDSNESFNQNIGKWQYINYSVVKDSIEYILGNNINTKLEIILKDYLVIIRRNLMNEIDKETQELCDGIYSKYKEVFDYIIENKSNKKIQILEWIEKILFENQDALGIVIKPEWQAQSYKRFTLKDFQVESNKDEGWVYEQLVLLEIFGDPEKYLGIKLTTYSGQKNDIPIIKEIRKKFPTRVKSDNNSLKEYNNNKIKWNGDIDDPNSKEEFLDEIKKILYSSKMKLYYDIIKEVKLGNNKK